MPRPFPFRTVWAAVALWGASACGDGSVRSPFVDGGAADVTAEAPPADAADGEPTADAPGTDGDPELRGPCIDDGQCDDGVECTTDSCDPTFRRCRAKPEHARCDNGIYCDGVEVCSGVHGCTSGEPVSCSDDDTCSIDRCVEETRSCEHSPRDADGDGDPDHNCPGGGDCNETDPTIASTAPEVCLNGKDDDCDGTIDEAACESPRYDDCLDPLEIAGPGNVSLPTLALRSDYAASCAPAGAPWRDAVLAVVVPEGPDRDVELVLRTTNGGVAVAHVGLCGEASSIATCLRGLPKPNGGEAARIRARGLSPGLHAFYVFTDSSQPITVTTKFHAPAPPPANETCGTAAVLAEGVHVVAEIIDATEDVPTTCGVPTGELVYTFDLAAARDVQVHATSVDGLGLPSVSLRGLPCTELEDEITCQTAPNVALFARALPAGTYQLAVSATSPTDVDLVFATAAPSIPPIDESCEGAPALPHAQTWLVSLASHVDDLRLGCLPGARDAALTFDVTRPSDVLLVERFSAQDTGAVSLVRPPCEGPADVIACGSGSRSPARAVAHGVGVGTYRVVVESAQANPVSVTAFVRDQAVPLFVPFADRCADAVPMNPSGGTYTGNTATATADYAPTCDLGGQTSVGAADQVLSLDLPSPRRVILDMKGSGFQTMLEVRRGPSCPGDPVVQACAAGYVQDRSFLDVVLPAGKYFVLVDGYNGDSGEWRLEAFLSTP